MSKIENSKCPACNSNDSFILHEIENLPAIIFPVEIKESRNVPLREIRINQCKRCGHIFQHSLDDNFINTIYEKWYRYYPFSNLESMNDSYRIPFEKFFLSTLQNKLNNGHRTLLEIGCGEESQLIFYLNQGLEVTAINPTVSKSNRINFVKGYYEKADVDDKFDIIVSRFNLEHIGGVEKFFSTLKKNLKSDGRVLIQVPNSNLFLKLGMLNIFAHEHVHYFSIQSLALMAFNNGFSVSNVSSSNESSLIVEIVLSNNQLADKFIEYSSDITEKLINLIENASSKVLLYGSGLSLAKLIYEGNLIDKKNKVIVIDDNPVIKSKVMPFSDFPINPLSANALENASDIILLLNPIYHKKVLNKLKKLNVNIHVHTVANYKIISL